MIYWTCNNCGHLNRISKNICAQCECFRTMRNEIESITEDDDLILLIYQIVEKMSTDQKKDLYKQLSD